MPERIREPKIRGYLSEEAKRKFTLAAGILGAAFLLAQIFVPFIFMIIAIFAVMYFLMIRPQQRQKKQHQSMLSQLSKGDKIVTTGGIHATVVGVKDSTIIAKIAENVKVELNRSSISQVVSSRSQKQQEGKSQVSP